MVYTEHVPVLANEVVEYLGIDPSGIYIDATAGSGGHASKLLDHLDEKATLILLDIDEEAYEYLKEKFRGDSRVAVFNESYVNIKPLCEDLGVIGKVDGILFDLGMSTHHVIDGERGFSFMRNGPLDMRFSRKAPVSAYDVVNTYSEDDLAYIFRTYGEEKKADEIARAIAQRRGISPIKTTGELADIVASVVGNLRGKHPATRVFQALRIHVNGEFNNIEKGIKGALDVLKSGGRIGIITYHSLEDKLVKKILSEAKHAGLGRVVKKSGIRPSWQEIQSNRKARSAILRIFEKR